jgi:hypothetical protein
MSLDCAFPGETARIMMSPVKFNIFWFLREVCPLDGIVLMARIGWRPVIEHALYAIG